MKKIYTQKLLSKGYLVLEKSIDLNNNKCTTLQLAGVLSSFSSLGFSLDKESVEKLSQLSESSLRSFYFDSHNAMKNARGSNVSHIIFYPNFPNMKHISDEEYFVRAVLHYLTASEESQGFMNQDVLKINTCLSVHNENKEMLHILSKEEAEKIIVDLVNASFEQRVAIPYASVDFIKEALGDFHKLVAPRAIPFKENIAIYISLMKPKGKKPKWEKSLTRNNFNFVTTVTDLLRVYSVLSDGTATLLDNVHFKSLSRSTRRLFLSILNDIVLQNKSVLDEFARHEFLWKKAFEKLHVGEYENQYPEIALVASDFRNDRYKTFYAQLENLKSNQIQYLSLLLTRPGEFARRLDSILRNDSYDVNLTLNKFAEIANKTSSTVLMQLWEFFMNRNKYTKRTFASRGTYSTFYIEQEDNRKTLSQETIQKAIQIIEESLMNIYATYPKYEDVFISEELKNYAVPRNVRNSSLQHKTLTYGTKIKLDIEEGAYLRFFTHWKNVNKKERVDIDLSLELVDENFSKVKSVSWHNMGGGREFDTYHSGDIISAPRGASEFVDLNYQKAREHYRYALITNSVFTGQEFAHIPECFSGVIFLPKKGKKGRAFQPEFVKHKFDLTQVGCNQNIAFAIDLKTLELIWMDCPLYYSYCGIVADGNYGIVLALKNALKTHMDMHKFLMLHKNHLTFAKSREEAKIIFSDSDDATIKPFDFEKFASEWL